MRTLVTWTCVILGMGVCGLVVSDALSWERWVVPGQVAGEAVLAQERRPATSPSRFARPVPRGWAAPSLVGARGHPDEPWRGRLTQLGLPVAPQAPRLGVGPAGEAVPSMEFDAGAQALPLPQVRLVKDVLDAMPDKCDERLFGGKWYCDIGCGIVCQHRNEMYLQREVDAEGYQVVSFKETLPDGEESSRGAIHARWKVDRKWHEAGKKDWYAQGRPQVALSCNGKSGSGRPVLSVNYQHPNMNDRRQIRIYIKQDGAMGFDGYDVRWVDGKAQKRPYGAPTTCRRSYERYGRGDQFR